MGLHQSFRFKHESRSEVREFLRTQFVDVAVLKSDREDFFVFSEMPGHAAFSFDCELVDHGILSERAGDYFPFLGVFIEAITGRFGRVEVDDA